MSSEILLQQIMSMIVSRFTQRSMESFSMQGSPMDHEHCIACFRRACNKTPDFVTSCDTVDCPRGCGSRYHSCKEREHVLTCLEERVPCINSIYGCPLVLLRRNIAQHLPSCAACVVFCCVEWKRLPLESPNPHSRSSELVMKKVYADCGQLDLALALRDHRAEVHKLLQSRGERWFPQSSVGFSGQRSDVDPVQHNTVSGLSLSDHDTRENVSEHSMVDYRNHILQQQTVDADTPLISALNLASVPVKEHDKLSGECSLSVTEKQHAINEGSGRVQENANCSVLDSVQNQSGSSFAQDNCLKNVDRSQPEYADKWESEIPDGIALESILSMSLSLQWIVQPFAKSRPMCSQEMRRDEFSAHYEAIHNHIHPGLGGWMEQRCPLAYLGCPFSFRRFGPGMPGTEIRHSWLLESFGLTWSRPDADPAYCTPKHLLPMFAETAHSTTHGGDVSAKMNEESSLEVEQKIWADNNKTVMPDSASLSVVNSLRLSASHSDCLGISDSADHQATVSLSHAVSSSSPGLASSTLFNDVSVVHKDKSFLTMLDEIECSSDQDTAAKLSQLPESRMALEQHRFATGPFEERDSENVSFTVKSHIPLNSETGEKINGSSPSFSQSCAKSAEIRKGAASGFTLKRRREGAFKQVIYSGSSANSCVRVSFVEEKQSIGENLFPGSLHLSDLPLEVLHYLLHFLDNFSLCNLSLVSHTFRDICCSLLPERGIVSLVWGKHHDSISAPWQIVGKRWRFSTSFDPVKTWSYADRNPLPDHLHICPYNQDKVMHTDPFSVVPLDETPLSTQIKDMLQKRLIEHRKFRGWIFHSNFEREFVDRARPPPRSFADVQSSIIWNLEGFEAYKLAEQLTFRRCHATSG